MDAADNNLGALTKEELDRELRRALEDLDEVGEMETAILGQTGVHIGMRHLEAYRRRFERDRERLNAHIAQIRARLAELESKA
jgi:hypothetical protein